MKSLNLSRPQGTFNNVLSMINYGKSAIFSGIIDLVRELFLFFFTNHISKHSYMYTNYSLLQTIQIISGDLKTNRYDYRPGFPANTRPRTSADQCWRIVSDSINTSQEPRACWHTPNYT